MLRIWRLVLVSLATILVYLTSIGAARANLNVCNATSDIMFVAEMDYQKDAWLTNAWFRALPRECAVVIKEPLKNRILYYVAITASDLIFTDPNGQNGVACLTFDPVSDRAEDGCREKGVRRYNWNKLDIGSLDADFVLTLNEARVSAPDAARACDAARAGGIEKFASCWVKRMATAKQARIIECAEQQQVWLAQAVCAANPVAEVAVVRAAACTGPGSSAADVAECMGTGITPEVTRVIGCLQSNRDGTWEAAVCTGEGWMTREQRGFAECAMKARLASTALVACVSTQATVEELQKCIDQGAVPGGCFDPNSDITKSVEKAWRDMRFEPGATDDLVVGDQGFSVRTVSNVASDIRVGGDRSNKFGCDTWFGKKLGLKC